MISSGRKGSTSTISARRIRTLPSRRWYPASTPTVVPMAIVTSAAVTPTVSETRVP